jgi:ribosomal-protein-alanine N-acetyltransferase
LISLASFAGERANPPLRGPRLRLEPMHALHAPALFPVISDPALYTWIDQGPPASIERLEAVYRRVEGRRSPDGSELWLNWVLFQDPAPDPTPAPLGYVQASVAADGRAWVAYMLGRSTWGQGYAAEAVAAMLQHLFGAIGVRQAMAMVEQDNARSIALVKRLGFHRALGEALQGHTLTMTEELWLFTPSTC